MSHPPIPDTGRIVHISTIDGAHGTGGSATDPTKWAVIGFARSAAPSYGWMARTPLADDPVVLGKRPPHDPAPTFDAVLALLERWQRR